MLALAKNTKSVGLGLRSRTEKYCTMLRLLNGISLLSKQHKIHWAKYSLMLYGFFLLCFRQSLSAGNRLSFLRIEQYVGVSMFAFRKHANCVKCPRCYVDACAYLQCEDCAAMHGCFANSSGKDCNTTSLSKLSCTN